MVVDDVLGSRVALLRKIVRHGFEDAPAQVQGFIERVVPAVEQTDSDGGLYGERTLGQCLDAARFEGYPAVARAGYMLADPTSQPPSAESSGAFVRCIERQRDRPKAKHAELAGDAVALLGIADGLQAIARGDQGDDKRFLAARAWCRALLEQYGGLDARLSRARALASDLLDDQGRVGHHLGQSDDPLVDALDLCLWRIWPEVLRKAGHPPTKRRRKLFKTLLVAPPPREGELIGAVSWLVALDVLTDDMAAVVVPNASQVARVLAETQGSFRRWRWEKTATRKNTMPTRWLIDKETDVQSFLLAVLYPHFRDQLEDEQYLRGFGLRQGRFDFAISGLGLIVEVKIVRASPDVKRIESEVAEDLALYFREGSPFKTMIVYIYDDRDIPEPEKYPLIRHALRRRSERIVEVIVVQRPSIIPNRDERQ